MGEVEQDQRVEVGTCTCGQPVFLTPAQARAAERFGIGAGTKDEPGWKDACGSCSAIVGARYRAEDEVADVTRMAATVRSRMTQSRMPEVLLGERVPGSKAGDPEDEREARLLASKWARDTAAAPGLLLWGDKGRGKTVLAAEAFAYALRRRPGQWVRSVQLVRDLYGEYGGADREIAEHVATGRVMVVLDDLDKVMGERSAEQLFNVVDALYSYRTPFLVTMNGTPDAAAARWGSVGPMIADRLAESAKARFRGPSYRRQAA